MAASAKGAISQVGRHRTETESVTAPALLNRCLVPVASANVPMELRDLSRLMPVVVLVPRTTIDERGSAQQTSRNTQVVQIEHSSNSPSATQAAMARF